MRTYFVLAGLLLALAAPAAAQEAGGAGRFDVTIAPLGGLFFTESSTKGEPPFTDFTLAGALTWHLTPWLALEGEFANAVGLDQELPDAGGTARFHQRSPSLYAYSGSLLVSPLGSNHRLAPYLAGGIGGLTLLGREEVKALGIERNETYLTATLGGGLKLFVHRRWGVRGEYRLLAVNDRSTAPRFFGREEVRFGHRVYGGLLLNY